MDGKVALYQIYFDEKQKARLFPFAIPYFNQTLTVFFENSIIADLVSRETSEKIGVCSYALDEKIGNGCPMRQPFTEEVINWDYDVLSLGRKQVDHFMLRKMEFWHSGSLDTFNMIFEKLGKPHPNINPKHVFYSNHFIARTDVYKEYVKDLLIPAMDLMEHDEVIRPRAYEDSGYYKLKTDPGYPKMIKEKLNMDYVPLHTFLCERLFSCWVNDKKLNIRYL